jgi:hypothetical protein
LRLQPLSGIAAWSGPEDGQPRTAWRPVAERWFLVKTWCPVVVRLAVLLAVPAGAAVVESPAQEPAPAAPDVTGQPQAAAGSGLLLWQDPGLAPEDASPMIGPGIDLGSGLSDPAVQGDLFDLDLFGILPPRPALP